RTQATWAGTDHGPVSAPARRSAADTASVRRTAGTVTRVARASAAVRGAARRAVPRGILRAGQGDHPHALVTSSTAVARPTVVVWTRRRAGQGPSARSGNRVQAMLARGPGGSHAGRLERRDGHASARGPALGPRGVRAVAGPTRGAVIAAGGRA